MLKSIGAFVCVCSREVVRFWEGPLREAPLYYQGIFLGTTHKALPLQSHMAKDLYTISMLRHVLMMVATYQLGKVYSLVGASH